MRWWFPWVVGVVLVGYAAAPAIAADERAEAAAAYRRYCASCHGSEGRGDGPDAARFARAPRNLREGFLNAYDVDELVERIRSGTPLRIEFDPAKQRDLETKGDALVAYLRRLAQARWAQVERGWGLYEVRCAECHGTYGHPPPELPRGVTRPRDLSDPEWQKRTSDADLIAAVRHGRKGMPALVPRIGNDEARALAVFVRILSPGFEWYQRTCAVCHGDDGRGVQAVSGEVYRLPKVRFDRRYFSGRSESEIRSAVLHMLREHEPAMPHFAPMLERAQIRAIVEYLRSLP